jgi:hypothetical protein
MIVVIQKFMPRQGVVGKMPPGAALVTDLTHVSFNRMPEIMNVDQLDVKLVMEMLYLQ